MKNTLVHSSSPCSSVIPTEAKRKRAIICHPDRSEAKASAVEGPCVCPRSRSFVITLISAGSPYSEKFTGI
jgi:hypothetical protein